MVLTLIDIYATILFKYIKHNLQL